MISALVLTKNEEKNIERCLTGLSFCKEIILIDDYSEDKTLTIAKKIYSKVKIYKRKLNNNFSRQRNFGLSIARGDWILFLDADEVISATLRDEIIKETRATSYSGFYIKRRDFFLEKEIKHGEAGNVKLLRLGRKNRGQWRRSVHEIWNIKGETSELVNPIIHYSHETIGQFIDDINKYSTIHALQKIKDRDKRSVWKILFFPVGKFIMNYFFKLGFLDGVEGFIMAMMMSFHSFLSWSKLWIN